MAVPEQLGLAGEAAVDGAGGEAGPAGDLLDAGPVVALLGEDLGGRVDEALAGRVARRRLKRRTSLTIDNGCYRR